MDIVFELDEAAKRQLHSAPDWIPRCLEYLAAREIEKLRGLLREALDNLDHRDLNIRGSSLADRIEEVVTPNVGIEPRR